MSINETRDFIFENYYKRIGFSKETSYYSVKRLKRKYLLLLTQKLIDKVHDTHNAKVYYQSFLKKKNRKSLRQSEIITYQPETFENPKIVDIKLVIT